MKNYLIISIQNKYEVGEALCTGMKIDIRKRNYTVGIYRKMINYFHDVSAMAYYKDNPQYINITELLEEYQSLMKVMEKFLSISQKR